jgi:hypothetical protein
MTVEIFLDIESVPLIDDATAADIRASIKPPASYSKQTSIDQWMADNADAKAQEIIHARGLKAETGRIICIGISDVDGDLSVVSGADERGILENFFAAVERKASFDLPSIGIVPPTDVFLIAHNAEFDLGFIRRRAWVNKVRLPRWFPRPEARVGKDYGCTMVRWAGYKDRISLANLCLALGVPSPKGDIDGSKVWEAYEDGRLSEIMTYCGKDTLSVVDLWEAMR